MLVEFKIDVRYIHPGYDRSRRGGGQCHCLGLYSNWVHRVEEGGGRFDPESLQAHISATRLWRWYFKAI